MRLGIIMDAIASIHYEKDTTLAMLWEADERGYEIFYFDYAELALVDNIAYGMAAPLKVFKNKDAFYQLGAFKRMRLSVCDVMLMRKDPPFNNNYLYATYVLAAAEKEGVLVINKPQALRDANEKIFISHFPQFIPPTLVTASIKQLKTFWQAQQDIVCKPLNSMGGKSIFRIQAQDVNANAIFELLTHNENVMIMAQKYIPDITLGDKRLILINGEVIPHTLVRIPTALDWRGNLAQGAKAQIQALTAHEAKICASIGPTLKAMGLYFVGLDIIGNFLTEINVTSPTGVREIEKAVSINMMTKLYDMIELHFSQH